MAEATDARARRIAIVAVVALLALLFGEVVTTPRFWRWDASEEYWADLQYLCGALWDGEWPRWNPFDRGGYSFSGDPQAGQWSPLDWALCAAGPSPGLWAAELRVALYFLLGGLGGLALARRLGLGWPAALVAAVALVLAPLPRRMWGVNPSYGLSLLPWVLWALESLAARPGPRAAAGLALALGAVVWAGSPPALYHVLVAASMYALFRMHRRALPWAAVAGVLWLGLAGAALGPASEVTPLSVQHGRDYASLSEGGIPPHELWGLVWPHRAYLYVGAPALVLAGIGARPGDGGLPRRVRLFALAVGALALVLLMGDHTPAYRVLFSALPGLSMFRAPQRFGSLLGVAVALLAAGGAARLGLRWPRLRWAFPALVLAALALDWPEDWRGVPGPAPGGADVWARIHARIQMDGGDVRHAHRVWDEFALSLRPGTHFGVRDLRGYQDPLRLGRYDKLVGGLAEAPRMLEQWSVKYLLRGPHFIHGTTHHYLPPGAEAAFADPIGEGVWRTRAPLPSAYWVPFAARFAPGDEAPRERLRQVAPRAVAFVESAARLEDEAPIERALAASAEMVAGTLRLGRNQLEVHVTAPRAGWLVVAEVWHPGWSAEIDGAPSSIELANDGMRALHVGAGEHTVRMRYSPRHGSLYAWAFAVSLACALGLLFRRDRGINPRTPDPLPRAALP